MNNLINLSPAVLLSIINTKLRNQYSSLDELCEDLHLEKEEIINILMQIDYIYDENINQFVSK